MSADRETVQAVIERVRSEYRARSGVGAIKARVMGLGGADLRQALKTVAYYERALNRAVLDFYRGDMEAGEFIDEMVRLVEGQFERAWNEGARDMGYSQEDYTDDDRAELQGRIDAELEHVLDYAQDIEDARNAGEAVGPLQARVMLWTNRYNEIVNDARLWFGGKQRLKWVYGDTEHCSTCEALNGIVATAEAWEASGYHPQGAPNGALECGGWRCKCSLEPTKEPATEGGIPDA